MPRNTKAPDGLTKQQRKFAEHYALHGNGAGAYAHAYPASKKSTPDYRSRRAHDLLRNGRIRSKIDALRPKAAAAIDQKFEITVERIAQEYAAIAFANSDDYFEWGTREVPRFRKDGSPVIGPNGQQVVDVEPYAYAKPSTSLTRKQKAAIVGASMSFSRTGDPSIEVKMANKLAALKDLGTFLKMFNQQVEHTGPGGGPVQVKDVSEVKALDPVSALKAFETFRQSLAAG